MLEVLTLDAELIARELYDPSRRGGCVIHNFLKKSLVNEIVDEIRPRKSHFCLVETQYRKVQSELEKIEVYKYACEDFPLLLALYAKLNSCYSEIGKHAGFSGSPNSFIVQRLRAGLSGIAPHRDFSCSRNLIEIVVLEGEAPFFLCDKDGGDRVELPTQPGSLILLRAPRSSDEKGLRPFHGVGAVVSERYTGIARYEGDLVR